MITNHKSLPARVYGHRIIGMALAGLPVAAVLYKQESSYIAWTWWFVSCFVWPHLAYFRSKKSNNAYLSERSNFTFDSFLAGTFLPLIHFNLLASFILVAISTADKINTGIRNLWLYGSIYLLLGLVFCGLLAGFQIELESDLLIVLSILPITILHTLLVSISSHKLIRKVHIKNQKLDELSRKDPLTQLFNCRVWQEDSKKLFQQRQLDNQPVSLLLIDIDDFKSVNDSFGHSAGDELLLEISAIISGHETDGAMAGRIGGDEFSLVLPVTKSTALAIGQDILEKIRTITLPISETRYYSVSIGIASSDRELANFREWFDIADKALYQAKDSGRNQIVVAE